jgi:hypothetical protein
MASMNSQSFGLSGVASTDLGLGGDLNNQLQAELQKRKKKAQQALTNPLTGSAGMDLLGAGSTGA